MVKFMKTGFRICTPTKKSSKEVGRSTSTLNCRGTESEHGE